MVACVNKMDLVDWDEDRFREIERDFAGVLAASSASPTRWRSRSRALHGDNVVDALASTRPWYDGPPLLRHLEQLEVARDRNLDDVPLPRPVGRRATTDYRGYAGQMAGGVLRPGDEVVVLPRGERTTVDRIETLDGPVDAAFPPMSVASHLADDLDAGRGEHDLRAPTTRRRSPAGSTRGSAGWPTRRCAPARRYLLKHTTRRVRATVESIDARAGPRRRCATAARPTELELNDIGARAPATSPRR